MRDSYERVEEAARQVLEHVGQIPDVAVVLGSGLDGFVTQLEDAITIDYERLAHWPTPGVAGHPGRVVVGACGPRRVIVLAGRVHLYEGRSPEEVVFGIRVLGRLGVRRIVMTNAAGGINPTFVPGNVMVIDDHINLTGANPLTGPNDSRFGTRFPDMSEAYAGALRRLALEAGRAAGLRLLHGVYIGLAGPNYETPAEIRAFRALGADAVGMSTVHEVIAARHLGMEVLGLSCISNVAAGRSPGRLTEADVLATTARARRDMARLLEGILARL